MISENVNFVSYIPTTVLGLIGLLFAYLYYFYKSKDNNKLNSIKAVQSSDRAKVIEMMLNDLGVQIDTTSLSSKQKYNLVVKLLAAKTRKYLITSITLIVLSLIVAFLINNNLNKDSESVDNTNSQSIDSLTVITDDSININKATQKKTDSIVSQNVTPKYIEKNKDITENSKETQNEVNESDLIASLEGLYEVNYAGYFDNARGNIEVIRDGENTIKIIGSFFIRDNESTVKKTFDEYKKLDRQQRAKGYYPVEVKFLTGFTGKFSASDCKISKKDKWKTISVAGQFTTMNQDYFISEKYQILYVTFDLIKREFKIKETSEDIDGIDFQNLKWNQ